METVFMMFSIVFYNNRIMEGRQMDKIDIADDPLFEPVFIADTQNIENFYKIATNFKFI
jgi:hypothetical protein